MMTRSSLVLALSAALCGAAGSALAETQPVKASEARKDAPAKRQRVVSDLTGFELLDPAMLKEHPLVVGATRGVLAPRFPLPLAPSLARVLGPRPTFCWQADDAASRRFVFVLRDEDGEELQRAEVDGFCHTWPASAPALSAGKGYSWSVRPVQPASALYSAPRGVVVVDEAERGEIERALAAAGTGESYESALARAQVLVDHRLWYDTIAGYTELIGRFPQRREAYTGRATVYSQIDLTRSLAEADFARAARLQRAGSR